MSENVISQEVFDQVTAQIKSFGDDTKKQYDELRRSFEGMKGAVDNLSDEAVQKDMVKKYTEDIITRQEALDKTIEENSKATTDRIDQLEVVLNRPGKGGYSEEEKGIIELARKHAVNCLTVTSSDSKGVTPDMMDRIDETITAEGFSAYKRAFNGFLRKWGGSHQFIPDPEHVKALSVGVDPDGGYTVTPEMSSMIIERLYESDPVRQLASVESITTGAIEWLVDWDDVGSGWEAETETGSETDTSQLFKKRIPVHVMYAKPQATQTLLEDSGINVEAWLARKVADRFMRREGNAFVSGDGVGKPRGFLTYDSGTSFGQVEQTNMGAAAAITADGLFDVKFSLKEMFLNRGTWLMNRLTVAEILQLKDGTGAYIWRPGLTEKEPATILGLPYKMATSMPTIAANALSVALADWKEAYMVVDRLGITVQRDPYTVKPFIEFYTRKRVGGDVINYDAIKIGKIAV